MFTGTCFNGMSSHRDAVLPQVDAATVEGSRCRGGLEGRGLLRLRIGAETRLSWDRRLTPGVPCDGGWAGARGFGIVTKRDAAGLKIGPYDPSEPGMGFLIKVLVPSEGDGERGV